MSDKKPENWKVNDDCFAFFINKKDKEDCRCLDKLYCAHEKCNFYKSKSELSWKSIEHDMSLRNKSTKKDDFDY